MAEIQSPEELRPVETPLDAGSQALSEALKSSFGIVKLVMILLLLLFLGSGLFTVGPQEQAMKIRLGRPVGEGKTALLGPGLHWSYPYPIDEVIKVPITSIQSVNSSVGWYATTPAMEAAGTEMPVGPGSPINLLMDGYAMTADANIVHTRATLTYHIADPVGYILNFVNASNAVQNALDNALLATAAQFKVDDLLIRDVPGFKDAVKRRATELVERDNLGIVVEECQVQSRPPRQLQDAFNNVLKAELARQTALTEAHGREVEVLSRATADAQSMTNAAESERVRLVSDIQSQAERFKDLLPKYQQNPRLFMQQRLTETLARVLTNAQDKIFLRQDANGKQTELRLLLNREPPKQKTEQAAP
ncbi:MAG TPA: protease modulator HflK [Candidatus Acidoferrum sp.]|nr:protease modulator HflK [Candidatus Acidoferrum sp.]